MRCETGYLARFPGGTLEACLDHARCSEEVRRKSTFLDANAPSKTARAPRTTSRRASACRAASFRSALVAIRSGLRTASRGSIAQFDAYEIDPGFNVDGTLTLGENVSDLGGLRMSLAAVRERGASSDIGIDGIADERLFFLAWAQTFCQVVKDEARRIQFRTDAHAPGRYRVNGPLSNLQEFAEAFQCEPGDAMVRKERCEIW